MAEQEPSVPLQPSVPGNAFAPVRTGVIRSITIDAQNVFNPENPEESGVIGTWGNNIHVVTREQILRRELLFKEGDPYDRGVIEESERNLRKRSYLSEVLIESHFNDADDGVDVVVHTRDQWSMIVGLTFGGTNENSSAGLDFGDKNLMGLGQSLNYSFRTGGNGYSHNYGYRNANLFGSRYDLWLEQKLKPSEYVYNGHLERPFYSLSTPEAHGVEYSRTVHAEPGLDWTSWRLSAYYGEAVALDDSILRAYLRLSFGEEISRAGGESNNVLRDNKVLISADILTHPHDFAEERYIDKFRRVEDIPLGPTYTLSIGPRLMAFGSTSTELSTSLGVAKWHQFFERDYLYATIALAKNDDNFNDNYADLMLRYYFRRLEYQTFVARFQVSYSESVTNRFSLGGTNGLRGYKVDEFTGRNQILINVEDRIFTYKTFLSGIFEPGFVIFADFGNTWYNSPGDELKQLYGGFGAGLRLALVKAPGISLIRVDYGVPIELNRPPVITIGMEGFF
ncbi:MAG: BamA/TamA family outer membrane protein [Nitrospinae bacterium]|nr:BamA/TamA family outer membrane protein [Nitrospinota bacterium]